MSAAPTLPDWDLTPYFTDVATPDFVAFRAQIGGDAAALRARAGPDQMPEAIASAEKP